MSVKTDAELKSDNNDLLSKIDHRYNHLTGLKTLIDDLIDSKDSVGGDDAADCLSIGRAEYPYIYQEKIDSFRAKAQREKHEIQMIPGINHKR